MAATTKVLTTSGKRKTATARATVRKGTGIIRINKVPLDIVQPELVRLKVSEPVLIAGPAVVKSLNIDVDVRGGGIMGQAEAARCAIARGIINWTNDVSIRDAYLAHDRNILVNDVRTKESKKYGGPGARAKFQKSYR
jgi:small subunit ribosomal protein S9